MKKNILTGNRWLALLQKRSLWPWLGAGLIFIIGLALGSDHSASQDGTVYLFGRTLMALTLTVGILYLSLQALKHWKGWMPRSSTRQIVLQETLSLGPRRTLHLIRVGEHQFLIAATDHQVTLISALTPTPAAAPAQSDEVLPISFADLLLQRATLSSVNAPTHSVNSQTGEAWQ
ncbi:MAG: flagellar biosynthetic protein FliO [Thermanaerothrix sp.]|nr:flagellar biosynthetic protein FliO [Thermanaerothrix sp.]